MGKDKKKKKKNDKELLLSTDLNIEKKCKSKCCSKYLKGENKRCKRCPMFDLVMKAS